VELGGRGRNEDKGKARRISSALQRLVEIVKKDFLKVLRVRGKTLGSGKENITHLKDCRITDKRRASIWSFSRKDLYGL